MPAPKKAVTLGVPEPLLQVLAELNETVGNKQKWMVFSAAILAFLEMPPRLREAYITETALADMPSGSWPQLIRRARSGDLRRRTEDSTIAGSIRPPGKASKRRAAYPAMRSRGDGPKNRGT